MSSITDTELEIIAANRMTHETVRGIARELLALRHQSSEGAASLTSTEEEIAKLREAAPNAEDVIGTIQAVLQDRGRIQPPRKARSLAMRVFDALTSPNPQTSGGE
jgi:hypothetical protein